MLKRLLVGVLLLISVSNMVQASGKMVCSLSFSQTWDDGAFCYEIKDAEVDLSSAGKSWLESDASWVLENDVSISESPNLNNFRVILKPTLDEPDFMDVKLMIVQRFFPSNIHTTTKVPVPRDGKPSKFYLDHIFGPARPLLSIGIAQSSMLDYAEGSLSGSENPGAILEGSCRLIEE